MRKLIVLVIAFSSLWGGYWFVGSSAVERGLTSWLSAQQSGEFTARFSSLKTIGFPNRFDTTITDPEFSFPDAGISWSAPFLKILALSYQPNHIIAALPNEQVLVLPYETLTVASDRMRASVVFDADTALTLNRLALETDALGIVSSLGWSTQVGSGQISTRQALAQRNAHDLFVDARDIRPSDGLLALLDPNNRWPSVIKSLKADTTLSFDAPWDRFAFEQQPPAVTGLKINTFTLVWAELEFGATGALSSDASGFLSGQIDITAKNWRAIYQVLVDMGLVQQKFAATIQGALEIMALETSDPDVLVASWVFENGRMRFGPVPLGPAPRLMIR